MCVIFCFSCMQNVEACSVSVTLSNWSSWHQLVKTGANFLGDRFLVATTLAQIKFECSCAFCVAGSLFAQLFTSEIRLLERSSSTYSSVHLICLELNQISCLVNMSCLNASSFPLQPFYNSNFFSECCVETLCRLYRNTCHLDFS